MEKEEKVDATVSKAGEVSEELSAEETAAFESGFIGEALPTETTPPASAPPENPVVAKVDSVEAAAGQPQVATDAQLKELLAKVNSVDELKSAIEKLRGDAFGKVGGLERTLKQLQDATPIGQPIEVKAEDLAELEAEFPGLNLGPSLAKGLTRVLGKFKGTGAPAPGLTPEEIKAQIEAVRQDAANRIEEGRKHSAVERLTDLHEDWQTVIGPPDSQTEFRTWLKGQGPEQEQAFLSSWDPRFISKTLSTFKNAKSEPPKVDPKPKTDTRAQRLAEAVPAKGGGIPPAKSKKTEEEAAFEEGFATSR
jgi:hypothetical protein